MATAEAAVIGVVRAGRLALVLQRQAHSHSWQQLRRCRPVLSARRSSEEGGEQLGSWLRSQRPRWQVRGLSEAERSSAQLAALAEYLEACGGSASMVDGWYTKTETRSTGSTAGTYDTYFFHPSGKRFRSRAEIARYFRLSAQEAYKMARQMATTSRCLSCGIGIRPATVVCACDPQRAETRQQRTQAPTPDRDARRA